MPNLLQPTVLGDDLALRNRICMGAMTRNRCIDDSKPTQASVTHYAERAKDGAGLIVAEGIFISLQGTEWPHAPAMFDQSHAEAWKKVTEGVHREGGRIMLQSWHPGRIQNENMPLLKDNGYPVLAPSRVKAEGGSYRLLEGCPGNTEDITEIEDPKVIVEQYRNSVKLAKEAGFDGIEVAAHGGYLIHNFLCSHSNKRTDEYGGSIANRCRFALEVVDAVIQIWGPRRVGIKICPADDFNDSIVSFPELSETYDYLIRELVRRKLGFITLLRRGCGVSAANAAGARPEGKELPPGFDTLEHFGPLVKYPGSETLLLVNHEYTVEEANELVKKGLIDVVVFSRFFIHNPDLVTRIRDGIPLATNDRGGHVYYGPYKAPEEGYNDWPRATG